jgi:hypothetical protein
LLARLRGAGEKSPFFPPFFKMKQFAAQRNKICVTYQLWIPWFTMLYRTVISSFLVAAAFAFAPSTPAQASGIEGQVRGVDGRPLQGAQVRIERQDKTGAPVTTQTNANGSYTSSALPAGIYKISVVENGKVKSNVTIQMAASRARVDFNLKPSAGANVKLYVLVPGAGTHLPPHWVEADANGTPIARGSNMDVASAALAQDMLRRQTNNTGR